MTLVLAVWATGVVLMSLPIFEFDVSYSLKVDAFVAACLALSTASYNVIRKPWPAPPAGEDKAKELLAAYVLSVLGIIGCLLVLVNAGTQLSLSYLLENLTVIRIAAFGQIGESSGSTGLAAVDGYLASFAFLSVIAAAKLGGRRLTILAAVNFVLFSLVGLFLTGSRTPLFYALLLALISLYVGGRRIRAFRPRTLVLAGVTILLVGYFSVAFFNARSNVGAKPEQVLELTQRARYQPWLAGTARSSPTLATGLISVGYFASPLPTLAFYLQRDPIPGPYWGAYSYPLPARVAAGLAGTEPKNLAVIRGEAFAPLESAGYSGNVWATWLRDLVIDFGYYGALAFCVLFGAFMAWTRNRFEQTGALHYHYFEVIACFTFAFGAFTSVLPFAALASAFFTSIVVMYATRIQLRERVAAPQIHRA